MTMQRFPSSVSLFLCLLVGCASSSGSGETTSVTPEPTAQAEEEEAAKPLEPLADKDPALARRLVEQDGALLLDVRTTEEFEEKHLDDAVNVPVEQLDASLGEIEGYVGGDKSTPIVVYCKSGNRAGKAKEALLNAGFTQVTNMGGIDDWCSYCEE